MEDKELLTDEWFASRGFDTSKLPFIRGDVLVYKNHIRDGSGRYKGYIVDHRVLSPVETVSDFIKTI